MSEFKTNKISPRKGTTTTIGDSGDSVTISSGTTTTNAGTISTAGITGGTINNTTGSINYIQGVISWDTTIKTTGFTAEGNRGYYCNTTSAAFTVTLPASPVAGDVIGLKDYANTFDTNNLTVSPNGNKINGSTDNYFSNVEGSAISFIYVDATKGWVLTDASKASDITEVPLFITATGGTETTCGDFKIHTFTGPGTFCVSQIGNNSTVPAGGPANIDYLVIAGGGGGGNGDGGGGAGAGGYRESHVVATSGCYSASPKASSTSLPVSVQAFPVTVGAGGAAQTNGNNSIFSTITSTAGGRGRLAVQSGNPGGSGGGGGGAGSAGSGNTPPVSPPQGNNGGTGRSYPNGFTGGGGGGAAAAGENSPTGRGGNGGNGSPTAITGSAITRAGGGGGGNEPRRSLGAGSGGSGGGGNGGGTGSAGSANTGSGGGGGGHAQLPGGAGGSGIVIIRYKFQ